MYIPSAWNSIKIRRGRLRISTLHHQRYNLQTCLGPMVFTWIFVVSALNSIYIRRGLDSKQTSNNSVTAFNNLNQYVFVTSCLCDCHTVHVYMFLLVTIQYTCTTSVNHDKMTTSKSLVTFAAILQQHGAPTSIWHM